MAYKFQFGPARLSGSVIQEGDVTAEAANISGSEVQIPDGGLILAGTAVVATAAEINAFEGRITQNEADIVTIYSDLSDEEAARIAADGVLQGNIDAEETARIAGDNTLQGNIDAEETARIAGDNTLQGNIDSLSGSVAADFAALETDFQSALGAEEAARIAADGVLQGNIDSLSGSVFADLATLDGRIGQEILDRQAAVSAEATARTNADASLQSQINDILSNTDPAALDSLTEIVAAFEAADSDLNDAIIAALGTHTSELAAFSGSVASDFAALETDFQSALGAEEAARIAADGVLQGNIDALETDVQGAIAALDGAALAFNGDALDVQVDGSSIEVSSDALRVKALGITNTELAGNIAADKLNKAAPLYSDAGALSVLVDDSSIEIDLANGLQVKALGITNDMLAGSIASSKLAELSAFSTSDLAEGANLYYTDARWDAKMAAASTSDLAEGANLYYTSARVLGEFSVADTPSVDMSYDAVGGVFSADVKLDTTNALVVGPNGLDLKANITGNRTFANDIVIQGDLTVNGTYTTINSTVVEVADLNMTLAAGAASATAAQGAGLTIDGADVQWKYSNNGTGAASASGDIWMAEGSGGTLIDIQAAKFYGELVGSFVEGVSTFVGGANLKVGVNLEAVGFVNGTTMTLPAGAVEGTVVRVKKAQTTKQVVIAGAGTDTVDGYSSITLESEGAAVSLIKSAGASWMVF